MPCREDVFWQISLRRDPQDARQMPGGMTALGINGAIRIVIFKFKNFRGRYLWCLCYFGNENCEQDCNSTALRCDRTTFS